MSGLQIVFRILEAAGALGVAGVLVYLKYVQARDQNLKRDEKAGVQTLFGEEK